MSKRPVPGLTPVGPLALPERSQRTLASGLTIIAVRRSSVPLVELRLKVPFARADLATGAVLGNTLLAGTETMTMVEIAAELQTVGGGLSAGVDADRLSVGGSALVDGLDRLLELLADSLTGAAYPDTEVLTERERLADRISVALTQPGHLARAAMLKRMFADHPYAIGTPEPEAVRAVRSPELAALHAARVSPNGAILVIVGDVEPAKALDAAERALAGWTSPGQRIDLPPIPELVLGPLTLVDRPGSVQSSLRLAMGAVPRSHPDHAPLQLANLIFGGYFSSRLVTNIREDKGYTYSPHSGIDHAVAGSSLIISADVQTEVTAPAIMEIAYELGRIALLPPSEEELEMARQYALGSLRIGTATQAGIAGLVSTLSSFGLGLEWVAEHSDRLAKVSLDEVAAAAATYFAPAKAVAVVLGEAGAVEDSLAALGPVLRG